MNNTISIYTILLLLFFTISGICQTPNSAFLHGRLIDAEDGQPIPDVLVRAAPEKIESVYPDQDFAHATVTDTEGTFSLAIPNEPQTYYAFSLMVLHPQYQAKRLRQKMSPAKNHYDLGEVSLKRTLFLQGNISGSKEVQGLLVNLKMHNKPADFFRAAAPIEHAAKTNTTGNFNFSDLYPIEYTLTISQNGAIIAYVDAINPQVQTRTSIHLPKLKTLYGTVVDTQELPIAEARIYATRHRETPHGHTTLLTSTQTNNTGNFQMQVLETESQYLSLEVSKKGYFSRVYENVEIRKEPLIVPLEKGLAIKGHVILPRDMSSDAHYTVKVFPADAQMEPSLNPLVLHKPLLSRHFPATQPNFIVDGLFSGTYMLYIVGEGISATAVNVEVGNRSSLLQKKEGISATAINAEASTNSKTVFIIADRPESTLQGQVLWAATSEPVRNAVVSRSWYPWELNPSDMSMTLDRFEAETDINGNFKFDNLTENRYQLHIRAVHAVFDNATKSYQRNLIHKRIEIPVPGTAYRIYLGKQDAR
ncbi:MAG: carboxypeptidase-like regulatory domain-containing protein [Candidatus Poribacteria bacterium]|nr:carboxypeptidase-like regulatory domain-containing protein [Candidatus Poribacteria bacterium]